MSDALKIGRVVVYFCRIFVKQGVLKGGDLTQVEIGLNSITHMLLVALIRQEFRWACFHLVELLEKILDVFGEYLDAWFN